MHIFLLHAACVRMYKCRLYKCTYLLYIRTIYFVLPCPLSVKDPQTEGIKGGELHFLISPLWCCLVAIMAVMKPHLSPSRQNLIIHKRAAVAWNEDECVLFKGRTYMHVQHKDGCLDTVGFAVTELLWVHLLNVWAWIQMVQNWINQHR